MFTGKGLRPDGRGSAPWARPWPAARAKASAWAQGRNMGSSRNRGDPVLQSFFIRFHQLPTLARAPSRGRAPCVVSFARYRDRFFRIPSAAEPLIVSLLPRKAKVLHRTFEPGPSWRFYCTLKRLPFGARPTVMGVESDGDRRNRPEGPNHLATRSRY